MDITTKTFGDLTQAAFNKTVGYFNRVGKTISAHFDSGVTYGVAAVFSTGDATHINKLLPALVIAGLEPKFRRTVVAHGLVPFKYDKDSCQYSGTILKGKRAALEMQDVNKIPQWEIVLKAALEGELPENKDKPAWKLETRLASVLAKAVKEGYSVADIRTQFTKDMRAITKAVADNAPESEVLSGDAQQAQIKSVAARKAA